MKASLKYLKVFTILIASFFAFSILISWIPDKRMRNNIERSLPELLEDGNYPKAILKGDKYRQDSFTDALILNIIISSDSKKPVESALSNPYSFHYPNDPHCWYAVLHLDHKLQNMDLKPNWFYGRYWFGSVFVTKILFLVITYQQIKWLLYIVSTLLLLIFSVKIVNRVGWIKSLPIFLALLFANFFVTQFSIQFFPVMSIALIGGVWMCKNGLEPQKKLTMFFFIVGIFTAYFDLLTTPMLTLGLPLVVYLILQGEEKKSFWALFKSMFILCSFWLIGFVCAWSIKWLLVIFFSDSTTLYAIEAIKWRTDTGDYTRWDAIVVNFNLLPVVWFNLLLTFLFFLTIFSFNKRGIPLAMVLLIVGLFPYIWYFVLSSHSYDHWWFTYRAQIISMSCAMLFFVSLTDWERLKLRLKAIISKSQC